MGKLPVIYNDDDTETTLPIKWAICCGCEGHGKSSAYLGAFTASEWDEQDDEFHEDYRAGRYDRPCEECDGTGKVAVADERRMTKKQRKTYREQCTAERECRAVEAAERRMEHFMDCRFAGVDPWEA